ncbi:EAL domain-containing protein [Vibrio sp. SCSIO 43136]|uniref:bifunctional diguanylate cyclase/phosphodiesterase n=1 Tax=Vibrio sp. SCSIO 43136 TaxID=2819101 RepID=UPI002075FF93|nr:EAL domain-containing protein [Vibrio sp. SCSIO 43136]USD66747.1 EAL domain-containing protein [Vibrio sp. SCSIO 43136]
MTRLNTHQIEIPDYMLQGWQQIVDLMAKLSDVPSALIMRQTPSTMKVVVHNQSPTSPYQQGEEEPLGSGLYCETVIETESALQVSNALTSKKWCNNPDIKLGMCAYYGLPLSWPSGEPFGTICILDSKENAFSDICRQLIDSFKTSVESQLALLYQHQQLQNANSELKLRVESRTNDLASLNFSLCEEIDRRKAAEQKVAYQQTHDLGTGFLNRGALLTQAQTQLKKLPPNRTLAFIHVGFTNGRRIQAKYSYDAFDQVLKQYRDRVGHIDVIKSVTSRVSTIDLVIGIEFDGDNIENVIESICHRLVDVSHTEFHISGEAIHLHAFIGIATSNDANNAKMMLKHANEAMLACRDNGKKYAYYANSEITSPARNQLESYLLQAVRNDHLMLFFQPKVDPKSGKWLGAEALLRWNHPYLGQVSNDSLIHLAEQNGLIFEVGNYVLRTAIEQASEWLTLNPDFKMAVNVSTVQLRDKNFVAQLEHLLETYHLPAHCLEIEVTESSLIADEYLAGQSLQSLHQLGITLSLDDFGTGYSSFSYLKKYPFDCIKIDKSFINQITGSQQDRDIVRSIIHVAKKLKLKVVMEGIETKEQEEFILKEECDFGQGYLYGKPMSRQDFERNLDQHSSQPPKHHSSRL